MNPAKLGAVAFFCFDRKTLRTWWTEGNFLIVSRKNCSYKVFVFESDRKLVDLRNAVEVKVVC